jgi:single-stranded DNA-binding protein
MNSYTATGRLVRLPELLSLADGTPMCRFRIAVEGLARGEVGFLDVRSFGASARDAAQVRSVGQLVAVNGRLQYANWEAEDGTQHRDWELVGYVEFLASRGGEEPPDVEPAEALAAA